MQLKPDPLEHRLEQIRIQLDQLYDEQADIVEEITALFREEDEIITILNKRNNGEAGNEITP